ncbi:MAG: aspartyl/asparaginyl beta-hydroxylase domain-containing protein [Myxococcales bacterium]|nr:aspartyl/asparaginyl beta-hydroxylase domain-containing protein [Myxococcales bacterium]
MFVDLTPYPFVRALEGAWMTIRDEAQALPEGRFLPWLQREMYGEGWSVVPLNWLGRTVPGMTDHCPATCALLADIPGLAMAIFSRLAPRTHIRPHVGWGDRVHRIHLALKTPRQGAWIRVGHETRAWTAGRCLGFDDTVEHEAANESDEWRTVLMLDVLRPGLTGAPYDPGKLPHEVAAMAELLVSGEPKTGRRRRE